MGRVPSPDVLKRLPTLEKDKIDVATRVQNAKFLYEMGKYAEAEMILVQVVKDDPSNRSAPYYLDLIKEARYMDDAQPAWEEVAKSAIGNVEATGFHPEKKDTPAGAQPVVGHKSGSYQQGPPAHSFQVGHHYV